MPEPDNGVYLLTASRTQVDGPSSPHYFYQPREAPFEGLPDIGRIEPGPNLALYKRGRRLLGHMGENKTVPNSRAVPTVSV